MGDILDLSAPMDAHPTSIPFHIWPQYLALTTLTAILHTHFPHSIPLHNRILAPHNTPSRHCLFAASFPPSTTIKPPDLYTIIFSDRSHNTEAQLWICSSLLQAGIPVTSAEKRRIQMHVTSAFYFVRDTPIPQAPGWPFEELLRFERMQTEVADTLVALCSPYQAVQWDTNWNRYNIPLSAVPVVPTLPEGLRYESPVPEDQLGLVISTSGVPRKKEMLMSLPNSCVVDEEGKAVAWAWCGKDGSLGTLYVIDEWRQKGLAKAVAADLLHKIKNEYAFPNLESNYESGVWKREMAEERKPFGRGAGYVFAEVKIGNTPSERTMEWLGGRLGGMSRYTFINSSKVPAGARIE